MPYHRAAEEVLSKWREVERRLDDIPDGSPEPEALQAKALRLRDAYRALSRQRNWDSTRTRGTLRIKRPVSSSYSPTSTPCGAHSHPVVDTPYGAVPAVTASCGPSRRCNAPTWRVQPDAGPRGLRLNPTAARVVRLGEPPSPGAPRILLPSAGAPLPAGRSVTPHARPAPILDLYQVGPLIAQDDRRLDRRTPPQRQVMACAS
jgi:hypothetical protein